MRNLVQYPITYDEVYDTLVYAQDKHEQDLGIGGTYGYCIGLLMKYMERHKRSVSKFLNDQQ